MSGYLCSDVYPASDPGCGRQFRSLHAFDSHFVQGGVSMSCKLEALKQLEEVKRIAREIAPEDQSAVAGP